ncbi:MAG: threonylcarbamoyl-AMP synthase [Ectothiorhodospiraceae bacterium]|nr:threonylcarbamoyl-AMP synthase [Ectothiorhodospiraceae bacterium]
MAQVFQVQPETPQIRVMDQIVNELKRGAVMLYPTDTVYAIGCDLNNKEGQERIRAMRNHPEKKPLTFIAQSISNIADYAHVADKAYKVMRRLTPGPYTFLLPASKLVPKLVSNSKRTTVGIRIPDHPICQSLVGILENPLISMSARLPENQDPITLDELFEQFEKKVDIIIDDETNFYRSPYTGLVSTMIDFTGEDPQIVREGLGFELAEEELLWP